MFMFENFCGGKHGGIFLYAQMSGWNCMHFLALLTLRLIWWWVLGILHIPIVCPTENRLWLYRRWTLFSFCHWYRLCSVLAPYLCEYLLKWMNFFTFPKVDSNIQPSIILRLLTFVYYLVPVFQLVTKIQLFTTVYCS